MQWLEFEITPEGEVIYGGAIYAKADFIRLFEQWLDSAAPGEYEVENLSA